MVASRGDRREEGNREASRPRTPRRSHTSKGRRDRYDQESVDSGYGGSSEFPSPQSAKHAAGLEGTRRQGGGDKEDKAHGNGHETDSDSDYDPKAKYYLSVDDNDYKNISFQGGGSESREGRHRDEDDTTGRRHRSNHDRHRSMSDRRRAKTNLPSHNDSDSDSDSDTYSRSYGDRSLRQPSRHNSASSRSRPRRESFRRTLSPIMSEPSEEWQDIESPERQLLSGPRSASNSTRRRRTSSVDSQDIRSSSPEADDRRSTQRSSGRSRRSSTRTRDPAEKKKSQKRELSQGGSSSYKGAADMDDAWYKTFKERLTKGVDMNQVRKVGLDAAAVAAVKVAVGTQIPWKQRIPKTIAVGLAAAVTDFLVSKTSFKPRGMVGTSKYCLDIHHTENLCIFCRPSIC